MQSDEHAFLERIIVWCDIRSTWFKQV